MVSIRVMGLWASTGWGKGASADAASQPEVFDQEFDENATVTEDGGGVAAAARSLLRSRSECFCISSRHPMFLLAHPPPDAPIPYSPPSSSSPPTSPYLSPPP